MGDINGNFRGLFGPGSLKSDYDRALEQQNQAMQQQVLGNLLSQGLNNQYNQYNQTIQYSPLAGLLQPQVGVHSPKETRKESNQQWLDRRVNEIRISLN